MTRIKIEDLPRDMKVSLKELQLIFGGDSGARNQLDQDLIEITFPFPAPKPSPKIILKPW